MSNIDLTHIKPGDTLALPEYKRSFAGDVVTHRLLIVDRLTTTQVVCRSAGGAAGEWRFHKANGKQVGVNYSWAEIATPELIDQLKTQQDINRRAANARRALDDMEGKYLHQLKLNLEQLEALAMAWTAIKAMKPAA